MWDSFPRCLGSLKMSDLILRMTPTGKLSYICYDVPQLALSQPHQFKEAHNRGIGRHKRNLLSVLLGVKHLEEWSLSSPDLDISYHLSQGSFFSPNQKMRCQPAFLEDTPKLYRCESPQVLPLSRAYSLSPWGAQEKGDIAVLHNIFLLKKPFPSPKVLYWEMVWAFRMGSEGYWEVGVCGGVGPAESIASQQVILESFHPHGWPFSALTMWGNLRFCFQQLS